MGEGGIMAGPWEKYKPTETSEGPWTKYASKSPKPDGAKTFFDTPGSADMSPEDRMDTLKRIMEREGRFTGATDEENIELLKNEYNKYTGERQKEVLKRSLAAPMSGVQQLTTAVGAKVTSGETSDALAAKSKELATEQAELDRLQSVTPGTTGMQTAAYTGATLPLAAVNFAGKGLAAYETAMQLAGRVAPGMATQTPKAAPVIAKTVDFAVPGAVMGAVEPVSNARFSEADAQESASKIREQKASQATTGGVVSGALAPIGAAGKAAVESGPVQTVFGWVKRITGMGATKEAEKIAAKELAQEVSASRGQNITPNVLANDVKAGMAETAATNERFGTNFQPTTAQTIGDTGAQTFQQTNDLAAARGGKRLQRKGQQYIPTQTAEGRVQEETANLVKQSREMLTPKQTQSVGDIATEVGEDPARFIQQKYKSVDFDDREINNALAAANVDTRKQFITAKDNYDKLYNSIDPKNITPVEATQTKASIQDAIDDLRDVGMSRRQLKVLEDFADKETYTARELVDLNAKLRPLADKFYKSDDLSAETGLELINSIRNSTKEDLANSSDTMIANTAKEANDLYRKTQEVLFTRPDAQLTNEKTLFDQMRRTANEVEGDTRLFKSAATIKDAKNAEVLNTGSSAVTERNVKNYLMADLQETLRNKPTPEAFDAWVSSNQDKIGEVKNFSREVLQAKGALVTEATNIATARNLLGGPEATDKAVEAAMKSKDAMQKLVNMVQTSQGNQASKDTAIRTLRQIVQDKIERDAIRTVQRTAGKATDIVEPNKYFSQLAENPETQDAFAILWDNQGENLQEAAKLVNRWTVDKSKLPKSTGEETIEDKIIAAAAAQASGARTMTLGFVDNIVDILSNREINVVKAKMLTDPAYAERILRAYKEPTPANTLDFLNAIQYPTVIGAGAALKTEDKPNRKMPVPEGVEPQKKSEDSSSVFGKFLDAINPISSAEAAEPKRKSQTNKTAPSRIRMEDHPEYAPVLKKLDKDQQKVAKTIARVAQKHGGNPKVFINFANAESTLGKKTVSGTSKAQGVMQVTPAAVKDVNKKYGKKLNPKKLEDNIEIGVLYSKMVHKELKETLGREPKPYEVYAGYFNGVAGLKTLLDPKNSKKAAYKVVPSAAAANKNIFYKDGNLKRPLTSKAALKNLEKHFAKKNLF